MLDKKTKSSEPDTYHESEPVSYSKSHLMKIKRMRQKKLLETTRGLKTEKEHSVDSKKKENVSKKKKALQNRISAQRSIEKKKNLVKQIKSEKFFLSNENENLRLELDMKNKEIEQLKSKMNTSSQSSPKEEKQLYNFSFTVGKSTSIFKISAFVILLMCILQCFLYPSTNIDKVSLTPESITNPFPRISRTNMNQIYKGIKEKLKHNVNHVANATNDTKNCTCVNVNENECLARGIDE